MNIQIKRPGKKPAPFGTWKCRFCGKVFVTKHLLYYHYHQFHEEELKRRAWNKGLTEETDNRVKRGSEHRRIGLASGRIIPSFTGKHHSEITREKMRKSALKSPHQRICKKTEPYTCIDGSVVNLDSSYERIVARILDDNEIAWIRPEPLPWIDNNGVQHHYFPDFYIPHKNLYLDPKNEYCFVAQAEKISCVMKQYNNVMFLHESDLTKEHILSLVV